MFDRDRGMENGARIRIALAAQLVELAHVLPEQAALGFRRDASLHGRDDVVPELLTGHVGREIVLVGRKGTGGRRGNPECRTGNLQQFDQTFPGHGISPVVGLRPCRDGAKMATEGNPADLVDPSGLGANLEICLGILNISAEQARVGNAPRAVRRG